MISPIRTIVFAILIFNFSIAVSQVPVKQWDATYGGSGEDELYSMQQTSDGGFVLVGSSESGISGDKTQDNRGDQDFWVVKTDAYGVKQWDATFGGSDDDEGRSIQQTFDGGYIVGGYSHSDSSGDKSQNGRGKIDFWIVKTDANGVKQWDATFGGDSADFLRVVLQTTDGGYVMGGQSKSNISGDKSQGNYNDSTDFWIVKTDANGVRQWDSRFGGNGDEFLKALQQTSDGGYIALGRTTSDISGDVTKESRGNTDFWAVKMNSNGIKEWDARFGGDRSEAGWYVYQTNEGGYVMGGISHSDSTGDKSDNGNGNADFWVVKTNSVGEMEWAHGFGGDDKDYLYSIQQSGGGNYIMGGVSVSGMSGDKSQPSNGGQDYWLIKTDPQGSKIWDVAFGGSGDDFFYFSQQTCDGGYVLGGRSNSGISGDKTQPCQGENDFWIVKTTPDGSTEDGVINAICAGVCIWPTNLTTTNITGTSAKLKWDAVAGAEKYNVRYKVTGTTMWTKKNSIDNSKPISGLSPNTEYKWEVETYCQTDSPKVISNWSLSQTFTTGSLRSDDQLPQPFSFQIYPNPVTDHASIQFTLAQLSHISLKVYDVSGKEIETVLDSDMEQGEHSLLLNTTEFSKGVYLVKMISDFEIENQKLIVR